MEEKEKILTKSNREVALDVLAKRPDGWKCTFGGKVSTKEEIMAAIAAVDSMEAVLAKLTQEYGGGNQLGKRYRCMVCGTEALATKAGPGRAECCGQFMETVEPKPIPSSD
ncbi:MAG: hypothetical protein PHW72_01145 [Candidatus Pacebacteria bacterium]|nr:hypothetical protein [Candidatus Paceibacterota bacterium]